MFFLVIVNGWIHSSIVQASDKPSNGMENVGKAFYTNLMTQTSKRTQVNVLTMIDFPIK